MSDSSTRTTLTNESLDDLSTSERHRLLAGERRRLVLEILAGEPPPFDLEGLAAAVAAREAAGDTVDADTVKRVTTTLHHAHLPVLADAGILAYDPAAHRIDLGE